MRTLCAYCLAVSGMLAVLLLSVHPAAAFSDTKPHFATTSACTTHVNTPQLFSGPTYTFNLCKAASQATGWSAVFLDKNNNSIAGCSIAWTSPSPTEISITCPSLPLGTITAQITWVVGSSGYMYHYDKYYRS